MDSKVGRIIEKHLERTAFLPSQGYESLFKVRRPEMRPQTQRVNKSPDPIGTPEPIKPGETIEVYDNGKWVKIKWPGK